MAFIRTGTTVYETPFDRCFDFATRRLLYYGCYYYRILDAREIDMRNINSLTVSQK